MEQLDPAQKSAVDFALAQRDITDLKRQVMALDDKLKRMDGIENLLRETRKSIDELGNRSGMTSQDFMRRAFSVWGHMIAAQLLVTVILGVGYAILIAVAAGQ